MTDNKEGSALKAPKKLNISPVEEIDVNNELFANLALEDCMKLSLDHCLRPIVFRNAAMNWPGMGIIKENLSLMNKNGDISYYQHSSTGSIDQSGTLAEQLRFLFPHMSLNSMSSAIIVFHGEAGKFVKLHNHEDTFLAQFSGQKLVTLAPESAEIEDLPGIYGMFDDCHADVLNPDFEFYPTLDKIKFLQVTLNPGDVLYIPDTWYHSVHYLTESVGALLRYYN